MQFNVALQNPALIAWDGTTGTARDTIRFNQFAFTFEVVSALSADAVFNVMYHDPTEADPCLPGPAVAVPEVSICSRPAVAGPQATVTIPAGTPVGSVCVGTLPCRPGRFVSLALASAAPTGAAVRATIVFNGPTV